jgi:hypothetical protein
MSIHAQFLSAVVNQLLEGNSLLLSDNYQEEMRKLYQNLWDKCYASGDRSNYCSFSEFWMRLIKQKNIPEEELQDYYHAKMQVFIIWKTLSTLYPFGQESIVENYILKKDKEFIDGALNQGCSNTLLTRLITLMGSEMYIPVSHDWKNSTIPAVIKPYCHAPGTDEDELVINHGPYGDKTLGDIYEDFSTIQPLDEFAHQYMVFLHVVEHELAQSIANLSNAYASAINLLGDDKDFSGQPEEQETSNASASAINTSGDDKDFVGQPEEQETSNASASAINTSGDDKDFVGQPEEQETSNASASAINTSGDDKDFVGQPEEQETSNASASAINSLGDDKDFSSQPEERETQKICNLQIEQFKNFFNQLLDEKLAPFKDLVSNKSTDPWENYGYKVWEHVALENKLMFKAPEHPGVYIIGVRSIKDFFDSLYHLLKEYSEEHIKSNDPQAWFQFKPTDLELYEALRKDESLTKYAKITFQSARNRPY